MFPLIIGLMFLMPSDPAVLTVHIPDAKEVWIDELHVCENVDNVSCIVDTNGKLSCGYLMFQYGTWLSYGKPFGATKENIQDDQLQKKVARSMLDAGETWHWKTCSAVTEEKLGPYPL